MTFSFGGTLNSPKVERKISNIDLQQENKWTRFPNLEVREKSFAPKISDIFKIKRGLATGDNSYFILSDIEIKERGLPLSEFRSILPSPRYLIEDVVEADENGDPNIDRHLFLLDPKLSEIAIRAQYPALWNYLEEGKARGLHERYLCSHRLKWYAQEVRPPAPIVCTYMGRGDARSGRPFRFILNKSNATAANVYLMMYPTPLLAQALSKDRDLIHRIWTSLNEIPAEKLLGEGRVYGGGLHKLEPKELGNVPLPQFLVDVLQKDQRPLRQAELFEMNAA